MISSSSYIHSFITVLISQYGTNCRIGLLSNGNYILINETDETETEVQAEKAFARDLLANIRFIYLNSESISTLSSHLRSRLVKIASLRKLKDSSPLDVFRFKDVSVLNLGDTKSILVASKTKSLLEGTYSFYYRNKFNELLSLYKVNFLIHPKMIDPLKHLSHREYCEALKSEQDEQIRKREAKLILQKIKSTSLSLTDSKATCDLNSEIKSLLSLRIKAIKEVIAKPQSSLAPKISKTSIVNQGFELKDFDNEHIKNERIYKIEEYLFVRNMVERGFMSKNALDKY